MAAAPPLSALVRRITLGPDIVPDPELLDRFVRSADQAAFELLVWRHGAMVWGACRRVLDPDLDAAEDACQAAFVALATHAARIRDRRTLAAWLHRVAVRAALALIATRNATRPLPGDSSHPSDRHPDPARVASDREFRCLLDTGLNRLPDKLRLPFVLCELEGRSNAEAAAALGCPVGTVESRLTRARHKLRNWLQARGVVPAVATAAVALPESARAAMVRAGVSGAVGPAVKALAARALPSVVSAKLRVVATVGLLLAVSAVGLGLTSEQPNSADPPPAKPADDKPPVAKRKDADDFPLPAGAVARLGSARLRHEWVGNVCFSPDGKRLVSADGGALRMWDAETGKSLFTVRQPEDPARRARLTNRHIAFANEGKVIVATWGETWNRTRDVWRIDAATGEVIEKTRLAIDHLRPRGVCFSPDCSRALLHWDRKLAAFDTTTNKAVWEAALDGGESVTVNVVAFSADGKTVAVDTRGDGGDTIRVFDAVTGTPAGVVRSDKSKFVHDMTLSPDGGQVIAAVFESTRRTREVVAWDRASGKQLRKTPAPADADGPMRMTPDGRALILWKGPSPAHSLDVYAVRLVGGPSGVADGQQAPVFAEMMNASAAVRPDGKVIAFGNGATVRLFDMATGRPVAAGGDPPYWGAAALRFSPDGRTLYGKDGGRNLTAYSDGGGGAHYGGGSWFAWDVSSGRQTRMTNPNVGLPWMVKNKVDGLGAEYNELVSPDGRFIARCMWEDRPAQPDRPEDDVPLEILDARTRAVVYSHRGKYRAAWHEFAPDGRAVVGGRHDGTVRVWAIDTGKELARMPGLAVPLKLCAISANGRVLATIAQGAGQVWDLGTGRELTKLVPERREVRSVAVSGDGRRVATVGYGGRGDRHTTWHLVATVWDVASGSVLVAVPQSAPGLPIIALGPDGRLFAVSDGSEPIVRVYETASGTVRFEFRHESGITGLAFAPDRRVLAAASKEAPVYLWDLTGNLGGPPPAWSADAADKAWEELTSKEAARAFPAIRLLQANPQHTVAFLKDRVKLGADAATLKGLFADLDSEDFPTREKATATLAQYGDAVRLAMEAEAARSQSAEVRLRLADLLKRLKARDGPTPDQVRLIRAVEIVESLGTSGAKALLEVWAGSARATLAGEAKAALERRVAP